MLNFKKILFSMVLLALFSSSHASASEVKNKEGFDVRVVAAYFDQDIVTVGTSPANTIQLSACLEVERDERFSHGVHVYDSVSMNCNDAARSVLNIPIVGRFWVYTNVQPGTLTPFGDATVKSAKLVRVFVATRKEAVRYSSGIGFYFGFENSFVARDQLSHYADATMRENNEGADIYQFGGLVAGTAFESVSFKPFMEFAGAEETWRVWENLQPRAGSDAVEGGMGSGNFILRANRVNSAKFNDVINENHLIVVPVVLPNVGSITTEQRVPEITTVSIYPGRREMELLLKPYVSTPSLYFSESQFFVQAGTKLWVRFSDQIANGRDVKMYWSLNGAPFQEAKNYLGGNCYGYKECFAVPVGDDADGFLSYNFTLTNSDGTVTEYKNGAEDFVIPVLPSPGVVVAINLSDIVVDRVSANATYGLKYNPQRAIDLLRGLGKVADELAFVAEVTTVSGSVSFPLGTLRSWTDPEMKIHYIGDLALTPHVLLNSDVTVKVKIKSRTRGIPDGEYVDEVGSVTIN